MGGFLYTQIVGRKGEEGWWSKWQREREGIRREGTPWNEKKKKKEKKEKHTHPHKKNINKLKVLKLPLQLLKPPLGTLPKICLLFSCWKSTGGPTCQVNTAIFTPALVCMQCALASVRFLGSKRVYQLFLHICEFTCDFL